MSSNGGDHGHAADAGGAPGAGQSDAASQRAGAVPTPSTGGVAPRPRRSQYKGVSKAGGMWRATVFARNAPIDLGLFDTPEDAAREYSWDGG
jgi:hypothetical protein